MSTRGYEDFTMADVQRRATKLEPTPKRSKYGSTKTPMHGRVFDSKKEAERYALLMAREAAHEIEALVCQPCFPMRVMNTMGDMVLIGNYHADFRYTDHGRDVVEDVKSKATRTEAYRLRKKLVEALYGIVIQEV